MYNGLRYIKGFPYGWRHLARGDEYMCNGIRHIKGFPYGRMPPRSFLSRLIDKHPEGKRRFSNSSGAHNTYLLNVNLSERIKAVSEMNSVKESEII